MRSIVVGVLCVLSLLTGAKAQVANLSERELDALLSESMLNEEAGSSLILDNTRTKIGREFYENFFREWSSASSDTLVVSAFIAALNPEDFTITIDELPNPNQGAIIQISVNDVPLWGQFVQPRGDVVGAAVTAATEALIAYFESYQDFQQQMLSDDMQGTGVY
jgi:hypothetical protein